MTGKFYPNVSITKEQAENIKKALQTKNWRVLKTWKEKFIFQCFCQDEKMIVSIGRQAQITLGLNLATYGNSEKTLKIALG